MCVAAAVLKRIKSGGSKIVDLLQILILFAIIDYSSGQQLLAICFTQEGCESKELIIII